MEIIRSLEGITIDSLFDAFSKAFIDYEIQLNQDELSIMLDRRGFIPELSFAAFKNERIIAFTFNGIGTFNGLKTAYDTGTGTLKEYRGQGLATKIFIHSIPFLKKAGISQYLLEVLQHNTKAVSIYKKLGFKVTREFNYFIQETNKIQLKTKKLPLSYQIHSIDLSTINIMRSFWDFTPSWQNDFEAIHRKKNDFKIIGVHKDGKLVGYCIFEPKSGDITQLAVDKKYRRKGIATALLKEMIMHNHHITIKVINTDTNCTSITKFFEANDIPPIGKQFEMIKEL